MINKQGVSVIICCFNSALRLPETIRHIALQEITSNIKWEVIIVNNNSTDNTQEVAQHEWNSYKLNIPFKVVDQPISGLSNARKKGVTEAQFEYIIFCDDDNWLNENYIQTAFEIMEHHPNVGAIGGISTAVSDCSFPDWFAQVKNSYAVGNQSQTSGIITKRGYLWGAGLTIRKELLEKIYKLGIKSQLTGRNGNLLSAGDDSEICKWIILLGKELYYDEKLQFKHFISKERLSLMYKEKLFKGFEETSTILNHYDLVISIAKLKKNKNLNFFIGLKYIIFKNKNVSRTYIQFLIGPIFKISSKNDYKFIKNVYSLIYN